VPVVGPDGAPEGEDAGDGTSVVGELTDDEIYDAILDQYVLPWEVEELPQDEDQEASVEDGGNDGNETEEGVEVEEDNSTPVDPDF